MITALFNEFFSLAFYSRFWVRAIQFTLSPCVAVWPRLHGVSPRRNSVALARRNVSLRHVPFFILKCVAMLSTSVLCMAQASATHVVHVALVSDGPAAREPISAALLQAEVVNVIGNDVSIEMPSNKHLVGDWTLEGADAALDRALQDKEVDIVLTLGVLTSHQAAQRSALNKPVIAAAVIDPELQHFPLHNGTSGRRNFTYVADFQGIEQNLSTFYKVVGFKHLVALIDADLLRALPSLADKSDALAAKLNIRITRVPVTGDINAVLSALPTDADAAYVTGLRLNEADQRELIRALNTRHVRTFSGVGRSDLEAGMLITSGGMQADASRLARRLVLSIQRIAQANDKANEMSDFAVGFAAERRVVINMRTAQAIGFSPRWQDLTDAEQLYAEVTALPSLSLLDAMHAALMDNPALAASRARLESSHDDVRIARSSLLPSLDASVARTRIDADRASPLTQAENTTAGNLTLQTTLYSERAWANYSIKRWLDEANRQGERQDMLDTLQDAATAYLDVLRAKSVEAVRRDNVENTRKNLETSRVREAVGLAERSDYLRWVAQLARDKQQLLSAEANRRQAEVELSRLMHRSAAQPYQTVETGLDDPLALVSSARVQSFLDTPAKWAVFTDYAVNTSLQQAPEIAQADAVLSSRERALTASRRAFYLPDVALVSKGSRWLSKSGAGSTSMPGSPNDDSWSVTLQASYPIFTGGLRTAQLSQAKHELRATTADRNTISDAVEARTRAALHRTGGSYPSIELSNTAAKAADENLAMVSDAYARGVVTVTELIDAQEASLNAGLAAVDAKYSFLSDFVAVLRSMGQFDILLESASREAWLQEVEQWFREHPQG